MGRQLPTGVQKALEHQAPWGFSETHWEWGGRERAIMIPAVHSHQVVDPAQALHLGCGGGNRARHPFCSNSSWHIAYQCPRPCASKGPETAELGSARGECSFLPVYGEGT